MTVPIKSLNSELYGDHEPNPDSFNLFYNFKEVLGKEILESGKSILDIGGADGEFIELINRFIAPVDGSVLEVDVDCIKNGRNKYPHIKFIDKKFPIKTNKKYDIVSMNSLFPQLIDWRETLLEMVKLSKKHLYFNALLTDDVPTIADDTISYVYYLDTGQRVPQVINNVSEIINFMCLEEMRVKRIKFVGDRGMSNEKKLEVEEELKAIDIDNTVIRVAEVAHVFRGLPFMDYIKGFFFIELFDEKDNPKRMGGMGSDRENRFPEYKFFRPEISIYLNDKNYFSHKDGNNCYDPRLFMKQLERI